MSPTRFPAALAAVLASVLQAGVATAAPVQVTNSNADCASVAPVSDSTGTIAAWQSDCNLAATNPDGSLEIFRAVVGSAPAQLTTGVACSSTRPSMSSDGNKVAFESDCNLTGANVDGNVEIFLWKNGAITQLTNSVGCDNLAPSINGAGTFIAFDSTCNLQGNSNAVRGSGIFRVSSTGVLTRLTDNSADDCDSTSASINGSGSLVAFDSDCNLTGENEDRAIEIFTVTSAGAATQMTKAPDDTCSSVRPSMDSAGSIIAFYSDCNFTGFNADNSDEIFTVNASKTVAQVTNVGSGTACASGEPRMAASGTAVAFTSYCRLNEFNGDGSIEAFQAGVGRSQGGILAVTDGGPNCSSTAGGISADGTRVMLDSDCNLATNNADESVEIYRANACVCGAPATRRAAPSPKASDALLTLRSAVGASSCALCECDTNNDQLVTASDALRTLKVAVGDTTLTLTCPAP
ncbi:MAG TPA: hypothetical protein VGK20_07670 [Candidatus Binatia bacterium]